MVKFNRIVVEIPSEEEFENISEEEFDAQIEELENVTNMTDLIIHLAKMGIKITEGPLDNELPGPDDTVH